jgi:hypothetical protein
VADEHTFTLIFEADGEVTPARPENEQPDDENTEPKPETNPAPESEPEPEEAEQ